MPLMGSLYIGVSGLQTSQNALNTTAHNLSNVDTKGYTRQQVQQSDKTYLLLSTSPKSVSNQQSGLGVSYSKVKQVRDYFLDKTYRRESGRSMFYEVSTEVMSEVEGLLGELNGQDFQTTLSDFWTSVQELTKDPCSSVTQGLFVQRASEFIERATAVYDGLCDYQDNLNKQIVQQVNKINSYGEQLVTLNEQIRAIEGGGVEKANDLRDVRNQLLDELAELTEMSFSEDMYGNVNVKIEGVDFVKGSNCYEMALQTDETTGFVTPFWPINAKYYYQEDGTKVYKTDGAEVYDLDRTVSTDLGTDIGGLKAMLLARGDHRADFTDVTEENYDGVSQSVIMNIQAEFDQMIHSVATKINDILAEAAGLKQGDLQLADGTVLQNVRYCESDADGYLRSSDGSPIQVFSKRTTEGYVMVKGQDNKEYWVYQEENMAESDSLYTLKNLQIDNELLQKPAMLGFRLPDSTEDNATMEALKQAFTEEKYTLNPNVLKKTNFVGYYSDMVSQIANSGYVFQSIYANQQDTVEATLNARDQVTAVSSDEELSNMIRFQNAYNASSRYINVISEMLEHVINTLGMM